MSIKIYRAWKVRIVDLNEFIDYVRPQVFKCAKKYVEELMGAVLKKKVREEKKKEGYLSDDAIRLKVVLALCKKASLGKTRSPFDLDFSLNVWLHKGYAYIAPIGTWNIKAPRFAKDYSYWNNSDRPNNVSRKEWEERYKTWDKINLGSGTSDHNARRLEHHIIELGSCMGEFLFEREMIKTILKGNEFDNDWVKKIRKQKRRKK